MLLEALETVRELRCYWQPKAGEVHRVKVLLRKAGVPVLRPRREGKLRSAQMDELLVSVTGSAAYSAVAIERALDEKLAETARMRLARQHEAIDVDIDKL